MREKINWAKELGIPTPPKVGGEPSGWYRLSDEEKARVGRCDDVVDLHDTMEVMSFEALTILEETGDYDKGKDYIELAIHKGQEILGCMGKKYGVEEFLIRNFGEIVKPLMEWLHRLYELKVDPEIISEATYQVDWILHEERFSIFYLCIEGKI
jgi:hypothetical protein